MPSKPLLSLSSLVNYCIFAFILGLLGCTESKNVPPQSGEQETTKEPAGPSAQTPISHAAESPVSVDSKKSADHNIEWFEGQIEEAFNLAAKEAKPLFLYWGALWCPPCEEIKQTVFRSPEFIALSKSFVPVYLDGDTEKAQSWGERFAVLGYPTMIVFNPAGEEITRIPGGIDIRQYNLVLAQSLESMRGTAQIYALALSQPAKVTREDYNQLAFYSWWQENLPEDMTITPQALQQLANSALSAGNTLAATRLQLQSLVMLYNNDQSLSAEAADIMVEQLKRLFADRDLVQANLDIFMFWSEELLSLVAEPGAARNELVMRWVAGMKSVRYLDALSNAEQIGSWYPELHFYWMDNPEATRLLQTDKAELLAHIEHLDRNTHGSARQAFVNRAYQVLLAARMPAQAKALLAAEIKTSHQPYYFMSSLAELEQAAGNYPAALNWLEKAYESAQGSATRFQWGVEYIIGMVTMQPAQVSGIESALASLLGNLQSPADVFTGRNHKRLRLLLPALDQWPSRDASTAVMDFYGALYRACISSEKTTLARANCQSLPELNSFLHQQGIAL